MGRGVTVMTDRRDDRVGGEDAAEPAPRYRVRETAYGFGVWDTWSRDWWVPRLDMPRRDAEEVVVELEARRARDRRPGRGG